MRRLVSLGYLIMGVAWLSACAPQNSDSSESGDRVTIGVSILTLTHAFFQDMEDALREEAERQNFDIVITSCEFDIAKQQNQVADFVVRQVDAIILAPCDSRAIGTSIQAANDAGIPVFTADIAALAEGVQVESHVATDNLAGGRLAGETMLEMLDRKGKVAIIDHPEVESVILRTRGFREVIDAANEDGADIEIVAQLPGGGVKDRAFRVAEDVLQAHPDLDAIFAINDDTALGTLAAIEKAGKEGEIQILGFDGVLEARRAIRDGKIYADVIQHPKEIGKGVVQAVAAYMAGETLEAEMLIPATLYRQADAEADPLLAETETP